MRTYIQVIERIARSETNGYFAGNMGLGFYDRTTSAQVDILSYMYDKPYSKVAEDVENLTLQYINQEHAKRK